MAVVIFLRRTFFLVLVLLLNKSSETSDFFIAIQGELAKCVTNQTGALAWINPDLTNSLSEESAFVPNNPTQNYFDCDISEDNNPCNAYWNIEPWRLVHSFEGSINAPVLDRRWEGFKKIYTDIFTGKTSITYESQKIARSSKENFVISLSIQTRHEAHVFLCDGPKPHTSKCYWLMLQAWQGATTALRKCAKSIPRRNGEYPEGSCNIRLVEKNHTVDLPQFLSETKWNHFIIEKNKNILSFSLANSAENSKILYYEDPEPFENINFILLHSKAVRGVWKLHNYDYILSREISTMQLGPTFQINNNFGCISMFVAMCRNCTLRLTVANNEFTFNDQTYIAQTTTWTEIKLTFSVPHNGPVNARLYVSTNSNDTQRFWAIDSPRICQKEEFRTLTTIGKSEYLSCQLISSDSEIISFEKKTDTTENNCRFDTVGDTCIPCHAMFPWSEYCTQIKFCYKNEFRDAQCFCSAGYEGPQCSKVCSDYHYGFGCKGVCGKCKYLPTGCNKITGKCTNGCDDDFTGQNCDLPPGPLFKEPPFIENVHHQVCSIRITNFEIQGNKNEQPLTYLIEFKEIEEDTWHRLQSYHNIGDDRTITIDNLHPDTNYLVRAILFDSTNTPAYVGRQVKIANFTTTCEVVTIQDVHLIPTNISIIATLKLKSTYCKREKCSFSIVGNSEYPDRINETTWILKYLTPFTDYTTKVVCFKSKSFNISIKTLEGKPDKVRSFKVTKESSTSVELTWEEPLLKNGNIRYYTLHYEHSNYKGCDIGTNGGERSITTLKIPNDLTSYTLNNLIPYSQYNFVIFASTTLDGEPIKKKGSTKDSSEIHNDETPQLTKIVSKAFTAQLQLSQINCSFFRGPLFLRFNVTCTSEWCKNSTVTISNYSTSIQLENLLPFSNYTLNMEVCRNWGNQCFRSFNEFLFTTKLAKPNEVRDVVVYSKGKNYISLRWKPPYPPTGILEEYKISYTYSNSYYLRKSWNDITINSNSNNCTLWSGYYCAKIPNLLEDRNYEINVQSRNRDPPEYSHGIDSIKAFTRIGVPDAPSDLNITWSERNELLLSWTHPSIMNGDLTSFLITITWDLSHSIQKSVPINEKEFNLTYFFKFPDPLLTSTEYNINVKSYNGKLSLSQASKIDSSPPAIPILDNEPELFQKSNISICAKIETFKIKPGDQLTLFILIPNEELQENSRPLPEILKEVSEIEPNKYTIVYQAPGNYDPKIEIKHSRLKPGTSYNVTVVLVNAFKNKSRYVLYRKNVSTSGEPLEEENNNSLFALLLLLLIIPIIVFAIVKRENVTSKLTTLKNRIFGQSIVERRNGKGDDEQVPLAETPINPVTPSNPKTDVKDQNQPVSTNDNHQKKNAHTKRIKIVEFEAYLKECINNGELDRQHALFPRGQTKPWTYGQLKVNKSKNRYNNLIAYDHSRVVLKKLPGNDHSDYINASYIDGYKVPKAYIATQGPKAATLDDFWRMIWQENVEHIVMLANVYESGKKKVEKYWPDINEQMKFLDITVQYVSNEVFADFEYRVFNVSCNGELRKLNQLHFTTWPDHGVPLYSQSLVPFLQRMLKIGLKSQSPVVVHCSAGVGRTGTVLLCDICLRMAAREGVIDVLHHLQKLRDQRANMVDNIEQYKLAHLVILECLVGMNTTISCSEIEESVAALLRNDGIKLQMRYLKDTSWQDQAMKTIGEVEEPAPIFHHKNRFEHIVPEIQGRVFLTRKPNSDETASYINAVKVDGFRAPDRFIVTQQPLPNTLGDFWRLIEEYSISVILSLNVINLSDKTSCEFWPNEKKIEIKPVDYITVQYVNTRVLDCYDLITVHVYLKGIKEHRSVEIVAMKNWPTRAKLPGSIEEFLTFWEESDALCRRSDQIVVTCYDGVLASGIYVAMSFIIEKMKLEQNCDVCQAVRNVRHNRHQFIEDEAQFEFLYQAAVKFINGFQSYSNFN